MAKKKIYLSPSNQQSNSYATGGTNEMAQCNRIASAAKTALERCGFEVKKAPEGQEMRVSINESNKFGADLHIPIHTNAGGGAGTEVFVYSTSDRNMKYAKPIYNELCKVNASKVARYIGTYRYGGSLTEITDTNAICVYCECEFHDNAVYARHIIDNATAYGEAIAKGVCSAFGVTYKSPVTKASAKRPVLDNQGYKKGQKSDGVLAIKELLLLAKTLKIQNQGMDENGIFGDGTEKAVNQLLKKWGYAQNGVAGDNFIKKLSAKIKKKI